jgi:hypothetical protein
LDANVYITAYRNYYAFDLVESFWKHLVAEAKTGRIVSIDRVKNELEDKDDPLCDWARRECSQAFTVTDRPDVIHSYEAITKWVHAQDFTVAAKHEFSRNADGWIIAYAKAAGHTIVTHERYEPNRKNKVKIPNICKQFGVKYVDTFAMLRAMELKIG